MNESPVTGPARRDSVVLLSQLIRQESRILLREPQWLASHLHNVLFLDHGPEGSAAVIEDLARDALAHRPWLRLLNRSGGAPSALRAVLDHGARVTAMAWSSDSKFLASGGTDGAVRLWEWPSGKMHHELTKISAPVTSLTWSPDGDLASGHSDGTALTWDSGTWRVKSQPARPAWTARTRPNPRGLLEPREPGHRSEGRRVHFRKGFFRGQSTETFSAADLVAGLGARRRPIGLRFAGQRSPAREGPTQAAGTSRATGFA